MTSYPYLTVSYDNAVLYEILYLSSGDTNYLQYRCSKYIFLRACGCLLSCLQEKADVACLFFYLIKTKLEGYLFESFTQQYLVQLVGFLPSDFEVTISISTSYGSLRWGFPVSFLFHSKGRGLQKLNWISCERFRSKGSLFNFPFHSFVKKLYIRKLQDYIFIVFQTHELINFYILQMVFSSRNCG